MQEKPDARKTRCKKNFLRLGDLTLTHQWKIVGCQHCLLSRFWAIKILLKALKYTWSCLNFNLGFEKILFVLQILFAWASTASCGSISVKLCCFLDRLFWRKKLLDSPNFPEKWVFVSQQLIARKTDVLQE